MPSSQAIAPSPSSRPSPPSPSSPSRPEPGERGEVTSSLRLSARGRRWIRRGGGVAGAIVVATGMIGVLHLPFASPLLRKLLPGSVCPVMRGTPAQIDRAHELGAAEIRRAAAAPAPVRPALGFELDKTRRSDLDAWSSSRQVSCAAIGGNDNLQRCKDIPPSAIGQPEELGRLEELTFEFKSSGELVNVQSLRRHLTPAEAAHTVEALERSAAAALGAPSTAGGEPTVAHLTRGQLSTYVAVHAFTDYRATISATNLAPTGLMVREEYLSVR